MGAEPCCPGAGGWVYPALDLGIRILFLSTLVPALWVRWELSSGGQKALGQPCTGFLSRAFHSGQMGSERERGWCKLWK